VVYYCGMKVLWGSVCVEDCDYVGSLLELSFLFSGMVEGSTLGLLAGCSMG
jgi:hypothetical protein